MCPNFLPNGLNFLVLGPIRNNSLLLRLHELGPQVGSTSRVYELGKRVGFTSPVHELGTQYQREEISVVESSQNFRCYSKYIFFKTYLTYKKIDPFAEPKCCLVTPLSMTTLSLGELSGRVTKQDITAFLVISCIPYF